MLWDIVVALLCVGAAGAVGKYLSVLKVWTYTTNIAHLYRTTFVTSFLLL